jgi:hypothetical protein
LRKARGSNGTGESIQKVLFYSIILDFLFYYIRLVFIRLVLVRDPDLVSPFFRDELLAPVLHFVSVDRGEGGLGGKRSVPGEKQGGLQIYNMDSGNVVGLSCRSE